MPAFIMGTCESEFESASAREGATGDATDDVEDGWEGEGDEEGNDEREDAVEEEEEEEEDMSTEDICALFRRIFFMKEDEEALARERERRRWAISSLSFWESGGLARKD